MELVYGVIGGLTLLIPLYFGLFSPLGHASATCTIETPAA